MSLRPKTKRRLVILLAGAAVVSGLGSSLVAIQLHRHELIREGFRDAAMTAYKRHDYLAALFEFKKYLSQNNFDAPAIYAYAVCRSQVPEPDLKHLVEARSIFSRYLEINPNDVEAQHRLLDIYRRIRYDADAQTLADALLAVNPNDIPALQAKLQSLIDAANLEPALATSMKINDLAPLDLESQMTTYRLMAALKRSPAEMVTRADAMLASHPNDPRFELLRAVAAGYENDEAGLQKWLNLAASRNPPDTQFTHALSQCFERVGMFEQARALLAKAVDGPEADPDLLTELIERQYEAGQFTAAIERLTKLNPNDLKTDARLLGLKALILNARGSVDDRTAAEQIRQRLAKRDGENVASSWNSLLKARYSVPPVEPRQAVALCQAALHRDPDNPVGRYFLGLSYNDLGESELALQCWRLASRLAPSWAAPHLSRAQAFLDAGRIDSAHAEAQAARSSSQSSIEQDVMLAQTEYQGLPAIPSSNDLDSVLDQVKAIQSRQPNESRTLPIYVGLLARAGQTNRALQIVKSALSAETPLPSQTLLALAQTSFAQHLGIEPDVADLLAQLTPPAPPQTYDRALVLAMLGERADGSQALTKAAAAAKNQAAEWQLEIIKYREFTSDGDQSAAWTSLGDANPKNLAIQRSILRSTSAWTDRKFIDRTIDRLKALTGDECITWRLARARWQLADDTNAGAGTAAVMMGDVVRIAPDLPEARLLWATALEKLGDSAGAIDRLRAASALDPGNLDISLRLADRLQLLGHDDEARDLLQSLSANPDLGPTAQLQIARALWQTGQAQAALEVLDSPAAKLNPIQRDLLRAQVLQSEGKTDEEAHIFDALLQPISISDSVLQAAAWFDAGRGNINAGVRLLDRLSDPREAVLAAFDEAFSSPEAAMGHYQAIVAAAPTDIAGWRALAGFQLRRQRFDDAVATVDAASKSSPPDRELTAIKSFAPALAKLPPNPELPALINYLSTHPTDEAGVQTLDALSHVPADITRLRQVSDKFPRFLPAQLLVAQEYFLAGQITQAQEICTRAGHASPLDPESARLLASIYTFVHQWSDALAAAQQWRSRTLDHPLPADLQIAELKLRLGDANGAISQLSAYLDQAKSSPNQNMDVIRLYACALARANRKNEADALLDPLLSQSSRWRLMWLEMADRATADGPSATRWIEKVQPQLVIGTPADRMALARECWTAGEHFNDAALLAKSRDILQSLANGPAPSSDAWLMLGNIAQQLDDLQTADGDFRKALQIDARNSAARNRLANSILARGGDLIEARRLAEESVNDSPLDSAFQSTLARINARQGDLDAAADGFARATTLDVENVEAFVGLADVQFRLGNHDKSTAALEQADALVKNRPITSPSLLKQMDDVRIALKKPAQSTSVSGSM